MTTERASHPALHPGRAAVLRIDGEQVGWLGELHPRLVRHFDLPKAPIAFEVALTALTARTVPAGRAVSRLPVVRRDLALVVDATLPAQDLLAALDEVKPAHVIAIRLFDVYQGRGLTEGRKSLAILVLMQDTSRTLTDAEIEATEGVLLSVAQQRFGATLRS